MEAPPTSPAVPDPAAAAPAPSPDAGSSPPTPAPGAGSSAGAAPVAPVSALFDASQPYQAPTPRRASRFGLSTVLLLAACAFGYFKYDAYRRRPPPPPPVKPAKPLREIPLTASPISAFKQAKEMIKVAGEKHQAAYAEVAAMDAATADGSATAAAPPLAGAVAAAGAAAAGPPATTAGAVGDTPAGAAPAPGAAAGIPARPPALPSFTAWAAAVKVGGVRPGARPVVIIDSISYELGDMVNRKLGIRLEALEPERRVVRFRDGTGTIAEVRY